MAGGISMRRVRWAAALGFLSGMIGLLASMVPSVSALEDSIGLRSLFRARGPIARPPNVTVVSVDDDASVKSGLPRLVREWPRSTHATLVDRLVELGASVVAFDMEFFRHDASED